MRGEPPRVYAGLLSVIIVFECSRPLIFFQDADACTVQPSQIKISAGSPSKYEALLHVISDYFKEPELLEFFRSLVGLPYTALKEVRLIKLPIMAAHFGLDVILT